MKEYMQMLIWLMLFVIVIEMIFPDTEYKKYIKLVLGCIIIYTIMQPVVKLIPARGMYNQYVTEFQNKLIGGSGEEHLTDAYKDQLTQQQNVLKETLSQSIKSTIERETDVSVKEINIQWQEKGDSQIDSIYLTVGEKETKASEKITIPQIHIGEKSSSVAGDEEKLKIKIKTCLNNFYNVQTRNIYITVQKN